MTVKQRIIKQTIAYCEGKHSYFSSLRVSLLVSSPLWMGTSRSSVFWERWGQMILISFCRSKSIWFLSSPPTQKNNMWRICVEMSTMPDVSQPQSFKSICLVSPLAILTSRAVRIRAMRVEVKWTDMSSSTGMFIKTSLWWQQKRAMQSVTQLQHKQQNTVAHSAKEGSTKEPWWTTML